MNGPTDLRWVDPRPTLVPADDDEQVVRNLLASQLTGDDLTFVSQLLGLLPSDRALSVGARDALSRRTSKSDQGKRERSARECPKGHPRGVHSKVDKAGRPYCLTCKSDEGLARRIANAERRKRRAA